MAYFKKTGKSDPVIYVQNGYKEFPSLNSRRPICIDNDVYPKAIKTQAVDVLLFACKTILWHSFALRSLARLTLYNTLFYVVSIYFK